MIFARIGHGPCYRHWNEIFAGVQTNKKAFLHHKKRFSREKKVIEKKKKRNAFLHTGHLVHLFDIGTKLKIPLLKFQTGKQVDKV